MTLLLCNSEGSPAFCVSGLTSRLWTHTRRYDHGTADGDRPIIDMGAPLDQLYAIPWYALPSGA
jgi:hypothetical protein